MERQSTADSSDRRGRPLEAGLRDRLLDHTLRVLLRTGYTRFSMIAVAQSARASKETLYRHFGDKDGLLHAALLRNAAFIAPLLHEGLEPGMAKSARFSRLGLNYLRACYRPGALALQRIAIADGARGLGPIFAEEITERALACVVEEFAEIGSREPREDAEAFLGSVLGRQQERLLLGIEERDLEATMERHVERAMRLWTPYLESLEAPRGERPNRATSEKRATAKSVKATAKSARLR